MPLPRVLYLGPDTPLLPALDLHGEAAAVAEVVGAANLTPVLGPVTLNEVARLLQSGHFDIIIIGTHGAPGCLEFTDGAATPAWLALQLAQAKPSVVILTACWSGTRSPETLRAVGEEIALAGMTTVAMTREVGDRASQVYSTEFVRAYALSANPRLAHLIALEQVQQRAPASTTAIVFVPGQAPAGATPSETERILAELHGLSTMLDRHVQQAEATNQAVQAIIGISQKLDLVSDQITAVVQERGVQQRMLEMLFESQQALVRLTAQLTARS